MDERRDEWMEGGMDGRRDEWTKKRYEWMGGMNG